MASNLFSLECLNHCTKLLRECILPEIKDGNFRPLEASDFSDIKEKFEVLAEQIFGLLQSGVCDESPVDSSSKEFSEFLVLIVIHCGENSDESLWTSNTTLVLCKSTFSFIFGTEKSCLTLLLEDHGKILKKLLFKLRPYLLSSTWKTYPSAVQCYIWCLNSLKAPHVGKYLDILLPTSLIIADDFTVDNKIVGVKCLHHIINNLRVTELQELSHEEVIYKTLEVCLLEKDANLIPVLISCLLSLLKKMYFLSTDLYSKLTHYDEIMTKYLYQLKLEGNINIKKTMIESLILIISAAGLISVRYLGNIIEIIDESSVNASTVLPALKVISELLVVCRPYIKHHLKQITFIVLKILYSSNAYKPLSAEEIRKSCKEVLIYIHPANPSLLQELIAADQFSKLNSEIRCIIKEVVKTS